MYMVSLWESVVYQLCGGIQKEKRRKKGEQKTGENAWKYDRVYRAYMCTCGRYGKGRREDGPRKKLKARPRGTHGRPDLVTSK